MKASEALEISKNSEIKDVLEQIKKCAALGYINYTQKYYISDNAIKHLKELGYKISQKTIVLTGFEHIFTTISWSPE